MVILIIVPTLMIAVQPDLGTSLLIASSGVIVILLAGYGLSGDLLSFARVGLAARTYMDAGAFGCLGVGVPFAVAAALTVAFTLSVSDESRLEKAQRKHEMKQKKAAEEAVAIVLSPDLDRIVYCTYLGGTGNDAGRAGCVARDGSLILAGSSKGGRLPTRDAFQESLTAAGYGPITAEILPAPPFYYAAK